MLIDILSQDNYNQYNITLANMIGLVPAVYLNELMNIYSKANRKSKLKSFKSPSEDIAPDLDFFIVNREYITKRTTITEAEQFKLDKQFVEMGILRKSKSNDNDLCLVQDQIMSLFLPENVKVFKKLVKDSTGKKLTKSEQTLEYLKTKVKLTLNTGDEEVDSVWQEWVNAMFTNPKISFKINEGMASEFKNRLEYFSNGNKSAYIELIKLSIELGYTVSDWVITQFKERHKELKSDITKLPKITTGTSSRPVTTALNFDEFF